MSSGWLCILLKDWLVLWKHLQIVEVAIGMLSGGEKMLADSSCWGSIAAMRGHTQCYVPLLALAFVII